ncbi:MAG: hypothetical protein M3N19_06685 [Candidatus Eremiobacteraeota bacterium]|nr:hypothetical protein [Candidatus Eremiobacteraeota bacterium]
MNLQGPQQQFGAFSPLGAQNALATPEWLQQDRASGMPVRRAGDGITFCPLPPGYGGGNSFGPFPGGLLAGFPGFGQIAGLINQLMGMLQSLMKTLGGQGTGAQPPETYYNDAAASSTGDPHIAFDGTKGDGNHQSARFDSMVSHADLVDSDSFNGGYQISTQVTAPSGNGATVNKSATLTTNDGQTQVTLDNAGKTSIFSNGEMIAIQAGQTLDLGAGQTVTKSNDGSLSMVNTSGLGGTMNTTFKSNGAGIDVTTSAHQVDLGGDIVAQVNSTPGNVAPRIWEPDYLRLA